MIMSGISDIVGTFPEISVKFSIDVGTRNPKPETQGNFRHTGVFIGSKGRAHENSTVEYRRTDE